MAWAPRAVRLHEVLSQRGGELGFAAAELAGGLGDRHTLVSAGTDQVGLELGHHAEDVKQEPVDGVGRIVGRSPEVQGNALLCQLVRDVGRVGQRTSKTVERAAAARTSPARHVASASRRPGRARVVTDRPWSTCT